MSTRKAVGDGLIRRPALQAGHPSLTGATNSSAKSSRLFSSTEPRTLLEHRVKASRSDPSICATRRPPGLS
eukprot:3908813-Pyramimonas_sp.AAC.1